MKTISERVGKTTIDHRSSSETKGSQGSYSLQNQILGRDLITPDEVGKLDNDECILFIRGVKPFRSKKYNLEKHPNYKKTGDFKDEYRFDIVEYNKKLKQEIAQNDDINIEDYILDDKDLEELIIT